MDNALILGNSISLTKNFIDDTGSPYDPAEVKVTIVRNVIEIVAGPFSSEVIHLGLGSYEYTYTPPITIVPGWYSAKWEGSG